MDVTMSAKLRLNIQRIKEAVFLIDPIFLKSPQYESESLSKKINCYLVLKNETLNPIQCFKGRGAELALTNLSKEEDFQSVVCASAGNLGQAVAYSAQKRNIPATVFASSSANKLKLQRIEDLGASLKLVEGDIEVARKSAQLAAQEKGVYLIEDSENIATCEGAGTIGLELLEYPKKLDIVLIALGGGALASGIATVFKESSPRTEIIAIQPKGAPAMALSWRAKDVVNTEQINTIADGVAGRYPIPEVLNDLLLVIDDVILVEEDSIKQGIKILYDYEGLTTEPSAALGLAAILENKSRFKNKTVATIICGANVLPEDFEEWILN